jgi:DNA (cytosine-5)-methyltransferase 1
MPSIPIRPSGQSQRREFSFYEFFSGGGMARLGLGNGWKCQFSNDWDIKKTTAYLENFAPANEHHFGDIGKVTTAQLPDHVSLAWASFPCQDLSLAGNGKGLAGDRSGVFWAFWKLMQSLRSEGRRPPIIALENVAGLISSHQGQDLRNLVKAFSEADYNVGAVLIDAALFLAQSRPRLFIIAVDNRIPIPSTLVSNIPSSIWHPKKLCDVILGADDSVRKNWIWWHLPRPVLSPSPLSAIIEDVPIGVEWHSQQETERILAMMSLTNKKKIELAKESPLGTYGTAYKRTRDGKQRLEVRFDGFSGCLRTPSGGSSRQIIIAIENNEVKTRLISPRETARLMGLPDEYRLPKKYNDAYHLTGDGVAVPAVAWLEQHILTPLAIASEEIFQRIDLR